MVIPHYKDKIFLPYSFMIWILISEKMSFVVKDTPVGNTYGSVMENLLSLMILLLLCSDLYIKIADDSTEAT